MFVPIFYSPGIHVLHAHDDVSSVVQESSVERHNVGRIALVHNLQFTDNAFPDFLLGFHMYDLQVISLMSTLLWMSQLTFLAITTFVAVCITLLTVPPFPAPSSFRIWRSSLRRSSLNSTPISRVSPRFSSFPLAPGICASVAAGAALGAGALRASPLTFFLFIVRVANASLDMLADWLRRALTLTKDQQNYVNLL